MLSVHSAYVSVLTAYSLQIEWARANDDKVKVIAENGRKYAQENLMPKDVYCYHAALFKVS